MTFTEKVLRYVHPDSRILDLGAGDGFFSKESLALGGIVTAVDLEEPAQHPKEIDWHRVDVQAYISTLRTGDQFDVMFSRNLIQFLDSQWVLQTFLPTLIHHLAPAGILGIQTFFRDPEPPFDHPVTSLFTADQLHAALKPLVILYSRSFAHHGPDRQGAPRTFFLVNVMAKKVESSRAVAKTGG